MMRKSQQHKKKMGYSTKTWRNGLLKCAGNRPSKSQRKTIPLKARKTEQRVLLVLLKDQATLRDPCSRLQGLSKLVGPLHASDAGPRIAVSRSGRTTRSHGRERSRHLRRNPSLRRHRYSPERGPRINPGQKREIGAPQCRPRSQR